MLAAQMFYGKTLAFETIVERLQAQRQEAEAGQAEATAREEQRRTQARAEIAAKRARFDEALALAATFVEQGA